MNKPVPLMFLGFLLLACAVLAVNLSPVHSAPQAAANPVGRFSVFVYPSGITGFFDSVECMVYVYDPTLDHCTMIRKITRLGEPMHKIK